MKTLLTVTALFVAASVALGGAVTGVVLEQRTGNPIAGATVTLYGANGQVGTGQTNDRGRYEVGRLAEGPYRALAEARGYEPAYYQEPLFVPAQGVVENVDFSLVPASVADPGAITGRVVDARTGEPVAGAVVVATRDRIRFEAVTNDRGVYELARLEPGSYEVSVEARGYERAVYPEPVAVRAGEVTGGIDFRLLPVAPAGAISGVVTAARGGEPIEGVRVSAEGEAGRGRAFTNARGYYLIADLGAGLYRVTAAKRGLATQVYRERVAVRAGSTTEGINFVMRPEIVSVD